MLLQIHFYCRVVSSFMDKYRFIYRFVDEYLSCFQFSATTNMAVIEF